MTRHAVAAIALVSAIGGVAVLGACGTPNYDWQCGTIGRPPINVDASLCERGTPGVKWYAADPNDLEADDISQVGLPLDDDYYERDTRKYRPTRSTRTVVVVRPGSQIKPTTKPTTAPTSASKPTTRQTVKTTR